MSLSFGPTFRGRGSGPGWGGRKARRCRGGRQVRGELGGGLAVEQPQGTFACPDTPAAGTWTGPAPSSAIFAAAALSEPLTTNQTSCERLITGRVRLIRSGGGFGEDRTAITSPWA